MTTYEVLNLIGTWVAGIGSLTASAVALWLVRRQESPLVAIYVSPQQLLAGRDASTTIRMEITNIGKLPVTLRRPVWKVKVITDARALMAADDPLREKNAFMNFHECVLLPNATVWLELFPSDPDMPGAKRIRAGVQLTDGNYAWYTLPGELVKRIREPLR